MSIMQKKFYIRLGIIKLITIKLIIILTSLVKFKFKSSWF
jgi:hypothetical protein